MTLSDVNTPPSFPSQIYGPVSIPAEISVGTSVITTLATDPDSPGSANATIVYSITNPQGNRAYFVK